MRRSKILETGKGGLRFTFEALLWLKSLKDKHFSLQWRFFHCNGHDTENEVFH